ncbi:MAG: hypothetical protein AB9M53_06985 [Leptothrix sp. (in: b-proteobacteria)]
METERKGPPMVDLLDLIGETYKVVGTLAFECGRLDDPQVLKTLDSQVQARLVRADLLPFLSHFTRIKFES